MWSLLSLHINPPPASRPGRIVALPAPVRLDSSFDASIYGGEPPVAITPLLISRVRIVADWATRLSVP